MQKEIFEQPESVVNTMRGRVNFDDYTGNYMWIMLLFQSLSWGLTLTALQGSLSFVE